MVSMLLALLAHAVSLFFPPSAYATTAQSVPQVTHTTTPSAHLNTDRHGSHDTIHASSTSAVPSVPFYSQFADISKPEWRKVGCGIASLAMLIDFYQPDTVSVDDLLAEGIKAHAYNDDAGWSHAGLIGLSRTHGLNGATYDLSSQTATSALSQLREHVRKGPVMASIHYRFDPKSTIPHLVVIDGIEGDHVYVNDPASPRGHQKITLTDFLRGWKKRFIEIRPLA